jgi:hypothetical protein
LRIISQFNDDDDEYFPHTNRPPEVSKGLLSPALPVAFGLNLSQLPAACAVSPCRHYVRPFRAIHVAVSVQLSWQLRLRHECRSRHAKLLMKIDQVTVMVVHLAATGQLMFKRQQ